MRLLPIVLALPALAGASAQKPAAVDPLEGELRAARAEQAAAESEARKLENAAEHARGEAAQLRARQAAAAQSIVAAEARITASDARLRLLAAGLDARRDRLTREQQPTAALLTGLAVMAQRPPLLAIAEQGSTDDFVRVRVLLDSTLPVIERRTAALADEIRRAERLEQAAAAVRGDLVRARQDLVAKRQQFAALESQALRSAATAGAQALGAGDAALAAGEDLERLRAGAVGARAAAAAAAALAAAEPAPARPVAGDPGAPRVSLKYVLPADARVTDGLGSVNASGIRSRGLTLATPRGMRVSAPADGVIRFSGPYRDYDGIMIIEHPGGWMSLLVNVSSQLNSGARVRLGDPLGRALGPIGVELSQNGRRISPALIAGSSQTLSNKAKGG